MTPTPEQPDVREAASVPLIKALHDLNVQIPGLPAGCHCNLVAEVALDAMIPAVTPVIRRQALLSVGFDEFEADLLDSPDAAEAYRSRREQRIRAQVAEEIAADLAPEEGDRRYFGDAQWNAFRDAAAIARSHAHPTVEEKTR